VQDLRFRAKHLFADARREKLKKVIQITDTAALLA